MSETIHTDAEPGSSGPACDLPVSPTAAEAELETEATESVGRSTRKFLLMLAVVAGCVALVHLTPLRDYVKDVQALKGRLQGSGMLAPLLFMAGGAALIAAGVPRLIFCALGGMAFGFLEGAGLAQVASLAGSYATFVFAKWGGRAWAARRLRSRPGLQAMLAHPSVSSVFLARQLPIMGVVLNLLFGLTPVSHRAFLLGSFLGLLPATVVVALLGSGLGKGSLSQSVVPVMSALFFIVAGALSVWRFRRKHRQTKVRT